MQDFDNRPARPPIGNTCEENPPTTSPSVTSSDTKSFTNTDSRDRAQTDSGGDAHNTWWLPHSIQPSLAIVAVSLLGCLATSWFQSDMIDSEAGAVVVDAESGRLSSPKTFNFLIDVNTASVAELSQLEGVGTVLAERIVAARKTGRRFQRPEDLLRVRGIGRKKLQANLGRIVFRCRHGHSTDRCPKCWHATAQTANRR